VAKKKTADSAISSPAPRSRREPAATGKSGPSSAAKKPTVEVPRVIASEQIGQVAGEVWHFLNEHGEQDLATVKKAIKAPGELTLAAIGWLAREGKLNFPQGGRSATVSLRE
jgi:hypothetical protein